MSLESRLLAPLFSLAAAALVSGAAFSAPAAAAPAFSVSLSSPDDDAPPPAETPAEPTAGVCGEGRVCCNVYDDWPSKGTKSCMAQSECQGVGKDVVADEFCK